MNKVTFSVLMPVYNGERFLREAIRSVLNQTFTDFEFLIIDDGSTDKSEEIIHSYTDPRIRYYKNSENLGISKTLNKGIDLATAEYIARMDSDDICYPDRLQKQYDFIQANPDGAFFTCYAREITEQNEFISISRYNPQHYFHSITFSCWIYHPTMVYRKDAVVCIGKYTVPYSEDVELAWQITRKFKHYHLPAVLLDYRVNTQSLWLVTKKVEYKNAFLQQIRRNIIYYLGEDSKIKLQDWKLELLSYYYDSIIEYSAKQIKESFDLQDIVTEMMIKKENPNRNIDDLISANKEKKEFLLGLCLSTLPYYKGCTLLYITGFAPRIPKYVFSNGLREIKKFSYLLKNSIKILM